MQEQTNRVVVPIGMHPDLFDGETPVYEEIELAGQLYEVAVSWREWDTDQRGICVFAGSEAEAVAVAVQRAEARYGHERTEGFEAQYVRILDREPRDEELADYHERQEVRS